MMESIRFDRIVSVNSQIKGHGAQNILDGEISPNKNWMCEAGTEKAIMILQLERATVLTSIHVGNAHSAFVEVLVGRAADSADQFESFVPMSSFMNPHESKTGSNPNRTRFFTKADFSETTASKSWDRIKVVCSQPFNKHVSYGLCFLKVHGEKELKTAALAAKSDDGDEIRVGSFFNRKRSSAGSKLSTVKEPMKEAEKELFIAKHDPMSIPGTVERMSSGKNPDGEPKDNEGKHPEDRTSGLQKGGSKTKEKEKTIRSKKDEKSGNEKLTKRKREEKRKSFKKPFKKLMEDVVLVISGFKNPLRGDIRRKALEMGAKYMADWESNCTHLVCAFENTPKCQQVKGKGKIVKKDWVEECHKDRKRYPWRRFALDKMELKKPESEEEVEAGEESEPEPEEQVKVGSSSMVEETQEKAKRSLPKVKSCDDDYEADTDDDDDNKNKEEVVDTNDYPMPYLPDIFSLQTFFVDPNVAGKATLERYIVAYNGVLTDTFGEQVDFYITDKEGPLVEQFRKKAPDLVVVKPSWLWEINAKQKFIPTTPHLVI